jgi:hypothetical protein
VTSPLSGAVLLTMVAAGAGGDTAVEMIEVLRLPPHGLAGNTTA